MKMFAIAGLAGAFAAAAAASPAAAQEPDGLVLPPGFHASVVADGLPGLRHLAIRKDGVIYASTRGAKDPAQGGIMAIHLGPDHKADKIVHFSTVQEGTGINFYKGALYATSISTVYRFNFKGDELVPSAAPQVVVSDMPPAPFQNRMLAFDDKGHVFVMAGGIGNICTNVPGRGQKPVGLRPCPALDGRGGIWQFDAAKNDQKFLGGMQVATGIRDVDAFDFRRGDGLYAIMHDRNGTHDTWPELVSATDEENISEELHRVTKGTDFGWPYTYYDGLRNVRVVAPEYGGDGKASPPRGIYDEPVIAFHPSHAAPLDMVFYYGSQFPASYRGGAFVAFHGGGGPATPQGHNGYDVVFIPFDKYGEPGERKVFADGFAGPTPASKNISTAAYRPTGEAVGPDGSLYISDSQKGRIWRIYYGKHG